MYHLSGKEAFIRGFDKQARLSWVANPIKKFKATQRLKRIKAAKPDAFGGQGLMDAVKRARHQYQRTKDSTKYKALRGAGLAALGTTGLAYGYRKLTKPPQGQHTGRPQR